MAVTPSTTPREAGSLQPVRRRFGRRFSATHVLIAIVVILAFVLNLLVLQDRSATTLVAVADQTLSAGSPIDLASMRLVPVDSDFEGLSTLITKDELAQLQGWILARPIPKGGLIDSAALVEPGARSGLRSMSLPVPVAHAAGGTLIAGDRVDVISVIDDKAVFVATNLEVIAVAQSEIGGIGTLSEYHVVVSVTADQALDLARSLDSGSIELVRATGAEAIGEGSEDDT